MSESDEGAIFSATLAGAFVFVPSICWTQSWAQDQGRPPAPPALVGMGLPEVPPEQVGMSKQKLDRIHDALTRDYPRMAGLPTGGFTAGPELCSRFPC